MKRLVSIFCILFILSSLAVPASAAEITPYSSDFFLGYGVDISEQSSTSFRIWFDVVAVKTMQEIGASYIRLERSSDGTNWSTVKTYTKSNYSNMIAYDTTAHASYVTYSNRQSGYQYRAYIELYAKDYSNGTGYYGAYTYL